MSDVASGAANGVRRASRDFRQPLAPFGFGKVEPIRRQRFIGCAAAGLIDGVFARLEIIGDLRETLVGGLLGERLDRNRTSFDVVEQGFEPFVKQRQPMLHAGMAAAFAHRLVKYVVRAGGAKSRDVAGAKQADRLRGELKLRHRHQVERTQFVGGALGLRIEAADRFQRVAEEIEPHRRVHAGREQVDDAAADGVIAGFAHRRCAVEAIELEPLGDAGHRQQIAGCSRERLLANDIALRHALQNGIHRRQQDRRGVAALDAREPRQRRHALRDNTGVRRHPIVGQAVPRWEFQHFDVRRKEAECARQHRHARAVTADHRHADRRRSRAGRNRAGEVGNDEAFGAVGNTGQRERAARRETRRRGFDPRLDFRRHRSSLTFKARSRDSRARV